MGHHRSIHRCDHWVVEETEETLEQTGGSPGSGPRLQSLFRQRFGRLAVASQELVGPRVDPV